jgi:hypothetical protein
MGYRGSKSISDFANPTSQKLKSEIVKEQRVDGSYTNLKRKYLVLRCTLMGLYPLFNNEMTRGGFERNYQVKILSKRNIQLRRYSSEFNPNRGECQIINLLPLSLTLGLSQDS